MGNRTGKNRCTGRATHVRFGSEADARTAKSDVRFAPDSDRKSGLPQKVMSASPPRADMCAALANVYYGPQADIRQCS